MNNAGVTISSCFVSVDNVQFGAFGTVTYDCAADTTFSLSSSASVVYEGEAYTAGAWTLQSPPPGALSITTNTTLPAGTAGAAYSQTLAASGGSPPYAWSVTSGSLPGGLTLSASGTITGTPTAAGTFSFTVQVKDSAGAVVTATFTVVISPGVTCAYSLYPAGEAFPIGGGSGSITVTAPTGCAWSVSGAPSWVTVTAGASGSGAGTVTYQAAANTGAWRTWTFTVAGVSFVVEQASATLGALATVGAMPHLAYAGGWQTTIVMANLGTSQAVAHLNFFDNNGNALLLPLAFPQAPLSGPELAAQLERTINPGTEVEIQTSATGSTSLQGWAQLLSNGTITGFARFDWVEAGIVQEAVVPLESRNPSYFTLWYDQTGGYVTGIAVANLTGTAASIPVTVRNDSGTVLVTDTLSLQPYGHQSYVLGTQYPVTLTGSALGTVVYDTPAGGQIAVLALRAIFASGGTLSTIPAMVP